MSLQTWSQQLSLVDGQGTNPPSDFSFYLDIPLSHAQVHGLQRSPSRPYFLYLLQETHTHATNCSDRAGQAGLMEGLPRSVGYPEHGLHPGAGTQDTGVQKALLCLKLWFLYLCGGADWD